jgi:hypothetical protein
MTLGGRFALKVIGSVAAATSIFIAVAATAQPLKPGASWTDALSPRPAPSTGWISRSGKASCSTSTCAQDNWSRFLTANGLSSLSAPAGGRSYRWVWTGTNPNGPPSLQAPTTGFVEVTIGPSGDARIRSSWHSSPRNLPARQLEGFEAALAKTSFSDLSAQSPNACLDECQDQIMEAVVNGRYHYVARDGGIRDLGIRDAGVILEKLAQEP